MHHLAIVGATATGKSRLAMALAERFDGEIVSADALQVYRGFDIGTAKPSPADRERVPHHLIDILEPTEPYSAGEFARRARRAIREIEGRGRPAIVAGGSGLYLRALFSGFSALPSIDPEVRAGLRLRHRAEGLEPLRRELAALDPATESRLAAGDTQRVLRALEVARATGRPLSEWLEESPRAETATVGLTLGLTVPRAILYHRVAVRVGRMIEAGWVSEVAHLLGRGLDPAAPAFQAIGYRQIARHVMGDLSLERALRETVGATRRFAKRQETWFRRESGVRWIPAREPEAALAEALELLAREGQRSEHA